MDDLALLTILDSFHKLTDSINASPSTTTAYVISSISGIIGIIIGFGLQWLRDNSQQRKKIKEAIKLIEFELKNIMDDAKTAISASSYLLDNYPTRDVSKFHVLNPVQRRFYDDLFTQVALGMSENKRQSIIISFSQISEYNNDISFIDDTRDLTDQEKLYSYEYMMWLATAAYSHAKNSLSKDPIKHSEVKIDHQDLAKELGVECKYLASNRQIKI